MHFYNKSKRKRWWSTEDSDMIIKQNFCNKQPKTWKKHTDGSWSHPPFPPLQVNHKKKPSNTEYFQISAHLSTALILSRKTQIMEIAWSTKEDLEVTSRIHPFFSYESKRTVQGDATMLLPNTKFTARLHFTSKKLAVRVLTIITSEWCC